MLSFEIKKGPALQDPFFVFGSGGYTKDIYETLGEICDEVCCPYPIEYYVSMAHHFPKLVPLTDEAFEDILNKSTTKDSK